MMICVLIQNTVRPSRIFICLAILLVSLTNCNKTQETPCNAFCIPEGFPAVSFPDSNYYTKERWELGKKLFYEKRLSIDTSISCGSCHLPQHFFTDNESVSTGAFGRLGTRNSPSLGNIAYHPYFLREGGVPTLEMQILVPIQEHNEFDHNIVDIVQQLQSDSVYVQMSNKAYNRDIDAYVITRAIATFERTLVSGNSNYDKYTYQNNKSALNSRELNGMNLFFSSRTNCSSCHSDFNFTNYSFKNNGLYLSYSDVGRMRVTNDSADLSLFKVPSLRNVAETAPYMHDGSFLSLEDVIEHYNQGGKAHPNKSNLVQPLNLTQTEKEDIILFLHSLTDWEFATNPLFRE